MRDRAEFVSGLARVHAGSKPAEHSEIVRRRPLRCLYAHQGPYIYRFISWEPDAGSHDAGDNVRATIELDRASDNRRVAVQLSLPELVTDNDNGWRFGAVALRLERLAEFGSKTESLEEVRCYRYAVYPPGLAAVAEVEFAPR